MQLLSDEMYDDDPIFKIILSKTQSSLDGSWNRLAAALCDDCVEFKEEDFR